MERRRQPGGGGVGGAMGEFSKFTSHQGAQMGPIQPQASTCIAPRQPFGVSSLCDKYERLLLGTATLLLTFTAATKIKSATLPLIVLQISDPVFPFITNKTMLIVTSAIELLFAVAILLLRRVRIAFDLLGVLTLEFLAYRYSLHLLGFSGNCSCAGHPGVWLISNPDILSGIANTALVFFCFASTWGSRHVFVSPKQR